MVQDKAYPEPRFLQETWFLNVAEVSMSYSSELAIAREAAELAGREIMALYAEFQAIADAPASISTEADRRSQEMILQHLANSFPGDAFCAEEAGAGLGGMLRQGPRLWIIDPIDGSRGFARKNDEFSVMIALVADATIALGVVFEPARKRLTYATRGGGCWQQDEGQSPQRCQVSNTALVSQATLVQSRGEKAQSDHGTLQPARLVLTYSAGIKLAQVARGEADIYLSTYNRFHSWDVCAGQVLVEEAGGRITNMAGEEISYPANGDLRIAGIIASNGRLHDQALSVFRKAN